MRIVDVKRRIRKECHAGFLPAETKPSNRLGGVIHQESDKGVPVNGMLAGWLALPIRSHSNKLDHPSITRHLVWPSSSQHYQSTPLQLSLVSSLPRLSPLAISSPSITMSETRPTFTATSLHRIASTSPREHRTTNDTPPSSATNTD